MIQLTKPASWLVKWTSSLTGAIERLLSNKLEECVSVKDFGAVGDGTTNDTAAFNAAAAAVSASGGGRVFVPRGRYLISSVTMLTGVSFCGESSEGVTLIPASNNVVMFNDPNTSTSHGMICTISCMSFDAGTVTGVTGIKSVKGNRVKTKELNFFGITININFDQGGNHWIENVLSAPSSGNPAGQLRLHSSDDAVYGAVFTTVLNYRIDGGSVSPAVYLRRGVGIKMLNFVMNDNTYAGTGILIENDAQGILIQGIIVGTGTGVVFQKGAGIDKAPICNILSELDFDQCAVNSVVHTAGRLNSIRGGMITSSDKGTGTMAVYFGPDSENCTVDGTYITGYYSPGGTCIGVNGGKGTQIRNVNLSGSAQGINLDGDCSRVRVTGSDASLGVTNPVTGTGTGADVRGLAGYKPAVLAPVATPSIGTTYTNTNKIAVQVSVFGTGITTLSRNGSAFGYTSGSPFVLNPNETLSIAGSGSVAWAWAPVFS